MVVLAGAWLGLFLLTMKVKNPRLEQVDILILFIWMGWFAYWTISTVRSYFKKDITVSEQPKPTEQTNAKSKKTPKSV